VQFGILGRLHVSKDGQAIEVKGAKQRALLTLLLLHPNQAVSKDGIIDALWGEGLSGREAATLRVHVAHLRQALQPLSRDRPELIITRPPGYLLSVDPDAIDANRFERLAVEGRRLLPDDPERAEERLREALRLWRGSALEEVSYELFAEGEARRLEELRLSAMEDFFEARLARDADHELVGELESLLAVHPLRERLWGHLMLCLYRSGRQADALGAYRRIANHLGELGLEPGPELRQLEDRILVNDPMLIRAGSERRTNRRPPAERTRLIGRAKQAVELQSKLKSAQILTLTGTGGVGKTRLAQHLAWSLIDSGTEVWWVELGGLADPHLISEQIAAAGGVAQGPDLPIADLLGRLLSERTIVVVLDNCEHLVDECARLVDELLTQAPELKFIVTSREPLQVPGELVWRVPSLPVPDLSTPPTEMGGFPSIELFLERARSRGIDIASSSMAAVATVCRRLDGIPLAIELAAARSAALSPEELSSRLNDRFALLERGGRTALARHRTLEAAIDWSFRLLSPDDQVLLSRLSVFVTGFEIEDAQAVCGFDPIEPAEVERGIERLVDKSMIELSGDPLLRRFRFTESIKAFAWDRLSDPPDVILERHRDWALQFARAGGSGILENDGYWFPRMEAAYEEFRAAFQESLRRGQVEDAIRLVSNLSAGFLLWRHTNEALDWLEVAVRHARQTPGVRTSTLAFGLMSLGPYLCYHNRFDEGCETLAEAAQLFTELNNPVGMMWTRYQQSFFPADGDPKTSLDFAEAAASLARQIGGPLVMGFTLSRLAETTILATAYREMPADEDLDTVLALCEEASGYCRQLPQSYASGVVKVATGAAIALQGNPDEGFALMDEGIAVRSRFHVGVPCAAALVSAGQLAFRLGYEERAVNLYSRGLNALKDEGLPYSARSALAGVAACLRKTNPVAAARLLGAAISLRPSFVYGHCIFNDEERLFDEVRTELGDGSYLAELGKGQRLSVRAAIDMALTHLPTVP
jgi:predicted ATPase/DNA-binding SARP family transcriptional activator